LIVGNIILVEEILNLHTIESNEKHHSSFAGMDSGGTQVP
jgi:hypothetical protein